jgi:hypothetical protein
MTSHFPGVPELDRQSAAFREMHASERVSDEELAAYAERIHPAPTSVLALLDELALPEDYEAQQWDVGRGAPKTVTEAKSALRERISDPYAPDETSVAGAYDGLHDPYKLPQVDATPPADAHDPFRMPDRY